MLRSSVGDEAEPVKPVSEVFAGICSIAKPAADPNADSCLHPERQLSSEPTSWRADRCVRCSPHARPVFSHVHAATMTHR